MSAEEVTLEETPSEEEEDLEKADTERPPKEEIEDMAPEKLAEFVLEWCEGRVMSSWHIEERNQLSLLGMVFMPLAMGALSHYTKEALDGLGLVWEYTYAQGQVPGRAINGFPMFSSCRLMNKRDWEKARNAINKELGRRKTSKMDVLNDLIDDMKPEGEGG